MSATMMLYNKNNGHIYGYFGTPYPTEEETVKLCFPEWDINQDDSYDTGDGEIWFDELRTDFFAKDDLAGTLYLNFDSGEVWTEEEIADIEEEELEELLQQGIDRTGGLIVMEEV